MKSTENSIEDFKKEISLHLQQQHVETRTDYVTAVRVGCHILFHDLSTHSDTIYSANNHTSGDGITCVAGHQNTAIFAFGEKCLNPRIFIKEYPSFSTVSTLEGGSGSHYQSLSFSEMEFLISLSSLPDFEIIVWSWRTGEKLISQKTGANSENQILRCSQTNPIVVSQMAADSSKLLLWELHVCCKKCLINRLEFNVELAVLPCEFTWSPDGILFTVDATGSVFTIEVEKRKLQHIFNWTGRPGTSKPAVVWYETGIVIAGPSGEVKYYKKVAGTQWQIEWSFIPGVQIASFSAHPGKDYLVAISVEGDFFQLKVDNEGQHFTKISSYGGHFVWLCLVNPSGDHIATLNASGCISTWAVRNGNLVGELGWYKNCLVMVSNPAQPYVALGRDDGIVDFINVSAPDNPKILSALNLCKEGISDIQFSQQGNYVVAYAVENGIIFVIETNPGTQIGIRSFINTKAKLSSFVIVELKTELKIVTLLSTQTCCPSGNKIIVFSMAHESAELFQQIFIDLPGIYSQLYANPHQKFDFYAIPHRSRQLHFLHMSLEKQEFRLIDARSSGHQLKKYAMSVSEYNFLTYGLDGMAILHSVGTNDCIAFVIPHHFMDLGIQTAVASPLNTHIISLGQDGSIICMYLGPKPNQFKETALRHNLLTKQISHMHTQSKTSGPFNVTGAKDSKSWLELQMDIGVTQEAAVWGAEKAELQKLLRSVQKECVALLEKNYTNSPEEKLPISAFYLDEETKKVKRSKTQKRCKEIELYLKALIVAQDRQCKILKEKCWNTMETKGRKLKTIMGGTVVENYPLFPKDISYQEELEWVMEYRRLEVQLQQGDCFSPWDQSDEDSEQSVLPSLVAVDNNILVRQTIISMATMHEEVEEDPINQFAFTGSSSHYFIEPCAYHHSQFELVTVLQMHNEIILLMNVGTVLREYFNQKFDEVYVLKEREMLLVTERNARLRYILSEMNNTQTEITDPEWGQEEQPERIMSVEDNEVGITPCISPTQQETLNKLNAEAETCHFAELADNFREQALAVMMDGVLEVRWEDEIKKDIPKPKCMLEKKPDDYNEEDLKIVKDYEERVAFYLSEREHYRKMLETEFQKVSQTLKDDITKFNIRLADLFLLKLKIEAAIGQESLKIDRYKYIINKQLCLYLQVKNLKMEKIKQESSTSALQEQIQQLQSWSNDCRAAYHAVVAREKHLEKNFKKEFPELSQLVLEQLLKFYRRRPNMHQRAQTSVILLNELSRCTVSADMPSFLPPEHLDFLKALDQNDSYSNSPPTVNEDTWATLCRVRRLKVECELKAKCCALEVADSEQTVSVYQKQLATEKQLITALQDEIHTTKERLLELQHNTELQLVMKQGLVEITTTGLISDFDDAILITREEVESVNELVKKAGNQKLAAMQRATNLHRSIIIKEWEHKKLKMKIEDLQDHLIHLQSMKVTRDIKMFLSKQATGTGKKKSIISIEQEVALLKESYEKTTEEIQKQLDDADKKIHIQTQENQKLNMEVASLSVDVNEQQLLQGLERESRQTEASKQRMASIVRRSHLVATIKKQHTEILVLQTELESLRLKTYPTLTYKALI